MNPPGWSGQVEEVSNGIYRMICVDVEGRTVERTGTHPESLQSECQQDIDTIERQIRQKRGKEIVESIRKVLFEDWDPVGVNCNENLRDEYDDYIPGVYRILTGSRDPMDIMAYLKRAESDEIEVSSRCDFYALGEKLLAIDTELTPNG